MTARALIALGATALVLAGCASTPKAEVTRFHLGQPIPFDTIMVQQSPQPGAPGAEVPLEFTTYANAVAAELARIGFRPVTTGNAAYLATLRIEQSTRSSGPRSSPVTIGIGGFTGGSNGGVSGGASFPVGGGGSNVARLNIVALSIRRQSDDTNVWEGRAVREIPANQGGSALTAAVPTLARALLTGFPGVSGQTVLVPLVP